MVIRFNDSPDALIDVYRTTMAHKDAIESYGRAKDYESMHALTDKVNAIDDANTSHTSSYMWDVFNRAAYPERYEEE